MHGVSVKTTVPCSLVVNLNKILVLDIETAPKLAYVWRFFKENISAKQVKEHGHIMSFAAKWLGEEKVIYKDNRTDDDGELVQELCGLLSEADFVIAHNGARFDLKQIRSRALVLGLTPPAPVKVIDTLEIAKREFSFPSNSLEYLSIVLNCNLRKGGHKKYPGFELWRACIAGDPEAWKEMEEYNILDILVLEEVYFKMRPWDTKHPNIVVHQEIQPASPSCPKCGSTHLHSRGFAYTSVGQYKRYHCQDCGGWSRSRFSLRGKDENLLANQVN